MSPRPRFGQAYFGGGMRGKKNQLEQAYADHLEKRKAAGEIISYAFEPEKLRLADNTFYSPDFRVVEADGTISFIEVKGFWRDDARVKIKVAAELHPYRFVAVTRRAKKDGGGWVLEEF